MEFRNIGDTAVKVSTLGLGCAPLGGNFVDLKDEHATDVVLSSFNSGLRYFDTAPWYGFGRSEHTVGNALRKKKNCVVSTKVGRLLKPGAVKCPENYGMINPLPFTPRYDYSYDGIMRAHEDSLQRLGMQAVDILLVHDIGRFQHGEENFRYFNDLKKSGYLALEELKKAGQIKAIGLGVNENEVCREVMDFGDWDVFLLAGRYTLLEQTPLEKLFPLCIKNNISIVCAGPFNSGLLVGREMWNYEVAPDQMINKYKRLKLAADEFNVSLPAAALQFPLANTLVSSVIPGPRSGKELKQILTWFKEKIPNQFWTYLKSEKLLHPTAPTPKK